MKIVYIVKIEDRVFNLILENIFNKFYLYNSQKLRFFNHTKKIIAIKKFNKCLLTQNTALESLKNIDNSKQVINISKKQVSKTVLNFLSLGDKFALPLNHNNKRDREHIVVETLKSFETNCHKLPKDNVENIRGSITTALQRHLCTPKHYNTIDRFLSHGFKTCNKFLHDNKDILVTKADKSQTTV